MNITKLKIWPELEAMGFEPINYRAHGRKVATGAALRRKLTSIKGEEFYTDIICIEPHSFSDHKNYHITGEVKTPFVAPYYTYEYGRKKEYYHTVDRINEFFAANNILPTITKMLS